MPHRRRPSASKAAPAPGYTYDPAKGSYFTGKGRGITPRKLVEIRNTAVTRGLTGTDLLAARVSTGEMTVQAWQAQMRQAIKDAYIQQYTLGRGGIDAMTQADWGRVGAILREQYSYLDNFAREIAAGKLSPGQIQTRARMYLQSATEAFERGKAAARGIPALPAYPGDGRTQCRVNCKCSWQIKETPDAWYCYWLLGHAEHCPDCVTNAGRWAPLIIPRMG